MGRSRERFSGVPGPFLHRGLHVHSTDSFQIDRFCVAGAGRALSDGFFPRLFFVDVPVDLEVSRADINARAPVVLVSGTNSITAAVHGSTAVITPRGHAGEEIEGRVQSNSGGILVVLDQRLGAVTITTNGSTLIRRGNTTIPLANIQAGMSVHVKAMLQSGSTYLSTEILPQDGKV